MRKTLYTAENWATVNARSARERCYAKKPGRSLRPSNQHAGTLGARQLGSHDRNIVVDDIHVRCCICLLLVVRPIMDTGAVTFDRMEHGVRAVLRRPSSVSVPTCCCLCRGKYKNQFWKEARLAGESVHPHLIFCQESTCSAYPNCRWDGEYSGLPVQCVIWLSRRS